jgi:predicted ArsR family transcriptional regulator
MTIASSSPIFGSLPLVAAVPVVLRRPAAVIIMTTMSERQSPYHQVLAADSRSALLAALQAAGHPLGVTEAAEAIGVGESTARFHLSLLVSAGLVTRTADRRASAGRPFLRYAPADPPGPVAVDEAPVPAAQSGSTAPGRYEELAGLLASQLDGTVDPGAAAREAGRRWMPELPAVADAARARGDGPVAVVTGLMDRLGFAPERVAGSDEIRLRACPFEAVARRHRAVVCGVHLGLLEQTVAGLGDGTVVGRFEPFVTEDPLLCVVGLRAAAST